MDIKQERLTREDREELKKSKFEFSIPISVNTILNRSEFFAFRDWEEGDILFDIRALKNAILAGELACVVLRVPLSKEIVECALSLGGIDQDHLNSKMNIETPIISVIWPEGTSTTVDGNHRIVKRYNMGKRDIKVILVAHPDWQKEPYSYWGENIPEDTKHLFDNLPTKEEIDSQKK